MTETELRALKVGDRVIVRNVASQTPYQGTVSHTNLRELIVNDRYCFDYLDAGFSLLYLNVLEQL